MEIWKEIFPFYDISNLGNCRRRQHTIVDKRGSTKTLKSMNITLNSYSNGYRFYSIRNKGYLAHRLVAKAFIPNPDCKRCVNHKDGNKDNNRVDNLEWVTYSENHEHAYKSLGRISHWKGRSGKKHGKSKVVEKLDDLGNVIETFDSSRSAAASVGKRPGAVGKSIREDYKVGGFKWRYRGDRLYTKD